MKNNNTIWHALRAAFPFTLPILTGFLFLGIAYGIYMNVSGFPFFYPLAMSSIIFGGSLEFVTTSMLLSPFAPVQFFIMAFLIQARHLFYGVSMLEKYKDMGWKKPFLIYTLCDETFSILFTTPIPNNVNRGWFYFFVSLLDYLYWIIGATIGGIAGSLLHLNLEGLDFVMTAMFVVIFLEQWKKEQKHFTSLIGLFCATLCLLLFGADSFMIPTMVSILFFLTLFRKQLEAAGGFA